MVIIDQLSYLLEGLVMSINLVVFSWTQGETFLNAVVSLVSQFQAPTSELPYTRRGKVRGPSQYLYRYRMKEI